MIPTRQKEEKGVKRGEKRVEFITSSGTNYCPLVEQTYVRGQVRATRGEGVKGRERERERGERAVADNRIKWSGGRGGARPRKLNRLGLSFG